MELILSVAALVAHGKVSKAIDPLLAQMTDGFVEVVDGFAPQDAEKSSSYKSIIVRFGGQYFEKYLDIGDRHPQPHEAVLQRLVFELHGTPINVFVLECGTLGGRDGSACLSWNGRVQEFGYYL